MLVHHRIPDPVPLRLLGSKAARLATARPIAFRAIAGGVSVPLNALEPEIGTSDTLSGGTGTDTCRTDDADVITDC